MQQECDKSKTRAVVRILKHIDEGEDLRLLARKVGKLVGDVGPGEMAAAQDRLRESGYPDVVVGQLLAAFVLMGVYDQKRRRTPGQASAPHIMQTVAAEHAMYRSLASDLERVLRDIHVLTEISDVSPEFRRLNHTVHHLAAMIEHFGREEDVILPYLKRQGWAGLCRIAALDHTTLRTRIDGLMGLVASLGESRMEEFKLHLAAEITGFCTCLREHLSFEDGLLWPIALVVINDPKTWEAITALCDEIGYCGIHM